MPNNGYRDRNEAGMLLAGQLQKYRNTDSIVLAIPGGGVPVGFVIAGQLGLPLDIIPVKKIGHPLNREIAIGAVSMDDSWAESHPDVSANYIREETVKIQEALKKRYNACRGNLPPLELKGKTVILVDDGIATGNTLKAAIKLVRNRQPGAIVVAVPVGPMHTVKKMKNEADEFICTLEPVHFPSVGFYYADFTHVSDEEIIRLLKISGNKFH